MQFSQGKCGAVGRVSDCGPVGSRFEPLMVFLPLPQKIRSSVNLRQLCRTQCRAERRTVRYGTQRPAPPPLYFLAGVTCGAYFYGLYYFAFLECVLPGVNQRPEFGQCMTLSITPKNISDCTVQEVKTVRQIKVSNPVFLM